ncbi:hypothetical protein ACIA2T_08865 [Amycolatopsis japonica]|uniref:hypothetical protein n=1 Tax=Amycolatopsis japonica TaxID=208439 RepID=UPI0037A82A2E
MADNAGQDKVDSAMNLDGKARRTYEGKRYAETYDEVNQGPGGNSLTARLTAETTAAHHRRTRTSGNRHRDQQISVQ